MNKIEIQFVAYDKVFLNKSWNWLNDSEIRKLVMSPKFTKEQQIQWFNSMNEHEDYLIWGIICEKVPIGVCGLKNITKNEGEYWGYIGEKSYWGKGIGKIMMNMVIDKAKEVKLKKVYLKVNKLNIRAIKLYNKSNFIIGNDDTDILLMTLELN